MGEKGEARMNGAESLVRTLVGGGVNVCFANPGTSEMHFVAALDRVDGMRCVLALHEGVVTGAADGYARMTGKPAATLLHLGPGLANGLSNLHNAGKASTPIVNIVGDHATYHRDLDAPLTSDIEGAARPFSAWVRTSPNARSVAADGAAAIAAARTPPGQVATLILPGDTAWHESDGPAEVPPVPARRRVSEDAIKSAAAALRSGEPTLLLLGGLAARARGLELAGKIAAKTGARLMLQTFNARIERGAGRVAPARLPYAVEMAVEALRPFKRIILVGAKAPVAFFAYPDKPSLLAPKDVVFHPLAKVDEDIDHALAWLVDEVGAGKTAPELVALAPGAPASGAITPAALGQSLSALLPEQAIVVDEGVTVGRACFEPTRQAPPHDWLNNMGGSIGIGPPLAVGAALASPGRKVVAVQADGSFMYSLQALWTQARENLDITTIVLANRSYAILRHELANVGVGNVGRKALDMMDLSRPTLDWVALARGMGVPGVRAESMEELNAGMRKGLAVQGPFLIEAVIP
jgi:acetolactate synthase-1/2/3 large subunit